MHLFAQTHTPATARTAPANDFARPGSAETLPGLVAMHAALLETATRYSPMTDSLMDSVMAGIYAADDAIVATPCRTDADVAAKLRHAAAMIDDPDSIHPAEFALLDDAIDCLRRLRESSSRLYVKL